jgi:hypothetical protein
VLVPPEHVHGTTRPGAPSRELEQQRPQVAGRQASEPLEHFVAAQRSHDSIEHSAATHDGEWLQLRTMGNSPCTTGASILGRRSAAVRDTR